jgi:hypothetical protein
MIFAAFPFWLQCIATAICLFVVDYCWTKWTSHVSDNNPHKAGLWSVAIVMLGGLSVIAYTTNHWLIIPAGIGAYFGTRFAVKND